MKSFFIMIAVLFFGGCYKKVGSSTLSAVGTTTPGGQVRMFPCSYKDSPNIKRTVDCLGILSEAQCRGAPNGECEWDSSIPVPAGICGYRVPLAPGSTGPCQHAHTVEECNSIPNSECIWNVASSQTAAKGSTPQATSEYSQPSTSKPIPVPTSSSIPFKAPPPSTAI
ncbi:MAG: hypothetical protein HQK54_14285 [Oligoflexales bacterium]|nr:hypothetical protein [Oligoflexales bacterium]